MSFISFFSRFIDRFAPCVLFHCAMSEHQFTVTSTFMYTNVTVVIDVLVIVYNRTWENRVMLSLHGQLVLDIRPRCWLRVLKLTGLRLVNFSTLSQHLCWYPAPPDHDSMNNPSGCCFEMWEVVKVASTICSSLGYRWRYSTNISVLI